MSILIKGIDIPKEGEWLEVIIKPTKEVIVDTIRYRDNALLNTEYGSAIQILTPHGRLIDGGELYKDFENQCSGECDCCVHETENYDCGLIANAPTILEAEE